MRLSLVALIFCLSAAHGAQILGLFGVSGKSHNHFFTALTKELANRGHDLTIVTAFPTKKTSANYKEIPVELMELFSANFNPLSQTEEGTLSRLFSMLGMFKKLCPTILNLPQIKPLLEEKFDLVIISTFFSQCFLPFGYINGAPMIGISAAGSLGMGMDMANPEPRSYVPNLFLPLTSKMTFLERVTNTLLSHLISFLATFVHKPVMYDAAKEFFGPNIPTIEEMEKNLSLVIYNNHFTLNNPRPLNPGVIDAGGMHIKDKNEKLPKDLQEFMDGAKDGIIYFSMGSYIKGSEFPEEKLKALLDAFSELPQRVIFKWETEAMPNKPDNVKIGKWLPQQAVLAHPNLKLFITHGGLLSTQEAAYHGVPLVGIPFFGDQQLNVAKSSRMGLAVGLDYNTLKKQTIMKAIKTVTNEPSYYKNAQDLKKRVRDQPESPLDRAVFWTEYVLRHNGAQHLRTAATDMTWWQVHLIDVYGAIFAVLSAFLVFDYYVIKCCCCRNKTNSNKKQSEASSTKSRNNKRKVADFGFNTLNENSIAKNANNPALYCSATADSQSVSTMRLCLLALVFCVGLSAAHGARILGLFGVSGQSHNHFFTALTKELANRGHDLTIVTAFPTKKTSANYKEIPIELMELFSANFNPLTQTEKGPLSKAFTMLDLFLKLCPAVLQMPQIKPLLQEKFDLVIISTFFSQCFLPFGYINSAPMIGISSGGNLGMGMDMANPEPRSYVPNMFLPLTSKMTFAERVSNTVMSHLVDFLATFFLKPAMHDAAKEFFGPNIPSIEAMEKNLSLVIYNNHFTLNNPRPLNPGVVDAGGMHIKDKNEKLPKDLQEFMDGAKDGVIYFSMGSFIQGSQFPEEKVAALLDAFSELPQRVIFKWETEEMPNKPNNVKIGKWLPQQAVLAHPNLKLFITHGGLLSTQEAAYHGVPLVGIPFFGDQQLNVAKSSRMGLAVGLDYNNLSKQNIINAIKSVINDPSFYKNAQELKTRVRDQPESPLDRAVFWTEYVLRHNGAPHLRTAATDMSWWQVHLIDVYGAIFAVLSTVLIFDSYLIKWCCCRRKSNSNKKQSETSPSKSKKSKRKAE
ncbi:uncharacterized protein LOC135934835 [Cloeon dipterum]|uniref:uncharacterized protein LOC135934835 n=1 Tax=Cloeon dipterum TaxID=197152 RepID=UPI00321F8CEF